MAVTVRCGPVWCRSDTMMVAHLTDCHHCGIIAVYGGITCFRGRTAGGAEVAMTVRLPADLEAMAKAYGKRVGVHSLNALIALALREYMKMRYVDVQQDVGRQVAPEPRPAALRARERGLHPPGALAAAIADQVRKGPVGATRRKKRAGRK